MSILVGEVKRPSATMRGPLAVLQKLWQVAVGGEISPLCSA